MDYPFYSYARGRTFFVCDARLGSMAGAWDNLHGVDSGGAPNAVVAVCARADRARQVVDALNAAERA